jgi:hypothetical protein
MRAFNVQSRTTVSNSPRKTWQWNSEQVAAEENRAKELQDAQRRFRKNV